MEKSCQEISTKINHAVSSFCEPLPLSPSNELRLSLSPEQLVLFASVYSNSSPPVLLITDSSLGPSRLLTTHLKGISSLLNVSSHWHLVESSLSPQEISGDVVSHLVQTIHHFLQRSPQHHFVMPGALLDLSLPDPTAYMAQRRTVHRLETLALSLLLRELVEHGYTRHQTATEPASFSVHGERLDIRLPHTNDHYQITWQENTIEQIVQVTQDEAQRTPRRSVVTSLTIPPACFPDATIPLKNLFPNFRLVKPLTHAAATPPGIIYDALDTDYAFPLRTIPTSAVSSPLHVLYENRDRVTEYLQDQGLSATSLCQSPAAAIPLSLQAKEFSLVSEGAIFKNEAAPRPISYQKGLTLVGQLTVNKPAVHSDHGIGIFTGLQTRTIQTISREYLILQYAAGDTLSVPVEYAHKVTPYLGEKTPPINRLGGTLWQKTRRQAKHDAEAFARELLEIAGQRAQREGTRYEITTTTENVLNRSFPHELTLDQETTLQEIYQDLQEAEPLDRLIVGDVGFGKTEVALRAARHVIENDRQVALLAPTTLLVQQHYDTARQRFPDLIAHIHILSRFATASQQKKTRQAIEDGTAKLVIGTHALLSKSTHWKNLGLAIIDEEQRFGVKHKEHFKKIRATVDVLSLSATPIPRTLSMALSGLRNLSVITTPPRERKEVITHVTRLNDTLLKQALEQELVREGQVYVVAPKVRSLGTIAHQIKALVPKASVAIAHGQLPPQQLAAIMHQFDTKEVSILVSSSIIENGLDLPNANTIIVMQAPHFGLSDLYQLRGRVGRRSRQGYAYFFYNQDELTSLQRQRLTALTEASRLGSGWSLAQRDLEIRGAGNLLGAEQSGAVSQIGVQLYLDMVHEALDHHSTQTIHRRDVDIQLPLPALIPTHYIAHDETRSSFYQQLSRAATPPDLEAIMKRITSTYGKPPIEFTNLILILQLQHALSRAAIARLTSQAITPPDEDPYWRISIETKDVKKVLEKLQPLGLWTVRGNHVLTHDVNDITVEFLEQLKVSLTE